MTAPVEDASSLPGKKIVDQDGQGIGEIETLYRSGEGEEPEWLAVDTKISMFKQRTALVPLARVKDESGELTVPYSKQHVFESPEVDASGELSADDERALRDHYGIDRGDDELRNKNDSYAARGLSEEPGGSRPEDS